VDDLGLEQALVRMTSAPPSRWQQQSCSGYERITSPAPRGTLAGRERDACGFKLISLLGVTRQSLVKTQKVKTLLSLQKIWLFDVLHLGRPNDAGCPWIILNGTDHCTAHIVNLRFWQVILFPTSGCPKVELPGLFQRASRWRPSYVNKDPNHVFDRAAQPHRHSRSI
jgi:hypothetical protein